MFSFFATSLVQPRECGKFASLLSESCAIVFERRCREDPGKLFRSRLFEFHCIWVLDDYIAIVLQSAELSMKFVSNTCCFFMRKCVLLMSSVRVDVGRLFVLSHRPSVSLCVFPTRVQQICLCIALALWSSSASRQSFGFLFGYESGSTDCVSLLHMVSLTFALDFDGRVLPR